MTDRPDEIAVLDDAGAWTWRALDRRARAHASRLAAEGIGRGERVAVMAPSSAGLIATVIAHLRLGVVHVPVNTRYREDEVAYVVGHAGARPLVTQAEITSVMAAEAAPETFVWPEPPDADALALIVYTSGTTGRPKGVMLSHRALADNLGAMMAAWRVDRQDTLALALPLFHVHGLGLGVLGALVLAGARVHLHAHFSAGAIVDAFRARSATVFMGVPTMYHTLIAHLDAHPEHAAALARGRLFTAGSAALSAVDFERFRAHTGHAILERYGMTETGFTLANPYDGERRAGTVGMPVAGARVRVVDEAGEVVGAGEVGEIEVQGAGMMDGYWREPEATAAAFRDGWFKTGDVALVEPSGHHRIVGRASTDIIKSGGFKIAAPEIEEALRADPRLAEVAVLGVPDAMWGEAIAVVVAPRAGQVMPDEGTLLAELRALVGERLADFKRPRHVRVVTALPRNAMGKVTKATLRGLFAEPG